MDFEPLTMTEAQGRGRPVSMRTLRGLAARGEYALFTAAATSERKGTLTNEMVLAAYRAAAVPGVRVTLDLIAGDVLREAGGYLIPTGAVRMGVFGGERRLCVFTDVILDAARRIPLGQHLSVCQSAETGMVHVDSILHTPDRLTAYGVAARSATPDGIYDIATSGTLYPPYLRGSE